MKRAVLAVLFTAVAAQACAPLSLSPRLTRRYAARAFAQADPTTPPVRLSVFATAVPRSASETVITSLAERGQAEMVRAMALRAETPQSIAEAMALPIRRPVPVPGQRDLTQVTRRLVFSVDNESLEPADRISMARIRVVLGDGARFTGWDRITTRFDTVDLGSIEAGQSHEVGAELGLTLPVLSAASSVSSSAGSTLNEEVNLRQRRVALTGALAEGHAVLSQQGASGIDLTGNVTADFEIAARRLSDPRVTVAEFPQAGGRPNCEAGPRLQAQWLRVPASGPVRANVYLDYVLRRVTRGGETVSESDDVVVFTSGRDSVMNVVVVPGDALEHAVFQVRMRTGVGAQPGDPMVLVTGIASGTTPGPVSLEFAGYADAMGMLAWLRGCEGRAAGYTLSLQGSGRTLSKAEVEHLYIWRFPLQPPPSPGAPAPVP